MRIALLTDGIYPYVVGGMQKHSFYMAKYLAQREVEVMLFHYIPHNHKGATPFSPEEARFIQEVRLEFPAPGKLPGHYVRESKVYSTRIADALDEIEGSIDLVYAQGFSGWELLQRKSQGKAYPPVWVNLHGMEMFQSVYGLKAQLAAHLLKGPATYQLRHADYVQSLGGKLTHILKNKLGIPLARIKEIPIGIDQNWLLAGIEKPVNERRKFVFIGRYEKRKGIEDLNDALKELVLQHPFEVAFIGPIPDHLQLSHPHIIYHGLVKETEKIQQILQEGDILLCPSHSEGMPTVIMEAMSNQCAIIATDVGAVAQQVDACNGWLIQAKDAPALRNAIIEAIEMETVSLKAKQLASFKRVKSFTWNRVIDQMLQHFHQSVDPVSLTST
ncbi:MAG: glycosyltransferase family 4 protein [Bacteroidota bacterium]